MDKMKTTTKKKNLWRRIIPGILGLFMLMVSLNCIECQTFRRIPQTDELRRENVKPELTALIDELRASVPKSMKKHKIPGCAFALVDDKGILWAEGFGTTDFKKKTPITPNTLFGIGSISKTFSATAVLLAVQDGLLDLDEPIIKYLPDFKVYSPYEERPESKITLRHLLTHTSGLPHEAVGCNAMEPVGTLEDRIKGIYGLWLKCPVGQAFYYSGAGYDLAGYILQVVSRIPFEQYMAKRIFHPLGMFNSTLDPNDIRSNTNRALGHKATVAEFSTAYGLLGAGGIFTSAIDLARFTQFLINRGGKEGNRVLNESLIDIMTTPHTIVADEEENDYYYGLGIGINRMSERIEMLHAGGLPGYAALMYWCPRYGVGAFVLTNRTAGFQYLLKADRRRKLVMDGGFQERFPTSELDCKHCIPPWTTWSEHAPSPYKPEWQQYCGTFRMRFSGYELKSRLKLSLALRPPHMKVFEKDGYLCLTESRFFWAPFSGGKNRRVDARLMEVKSGVFYTASADVLDFSGKDPTWLSYRLKKQ